MARQRDGARVGREIKHAEAVDVGMADRSDGRDAAQGYQYHD
jgi:hypothetical protein